MKIKTDYYLIKILGDVEPFIEGQYNSDEERLKKAQEIRKDNENHDGLYDGLYRLNIVEGKPEISCFYGNEFDGSGKSEY